MSGEGLARYCTVGILYTRAQSNTLLTCFVEHSNPRRSSHPIAFHTSRSSTVSSPAMHGNDLMKRVGFQSTSPDKIDLNSTASLAPHPHPHHQHQSLPSLTTSPLQVDSLFHESTMTLNWGKGKGKRPFSPQSTHGLNVSFKSWRVFAHHAVLCLAHFSEDLGWAKEEHGFSSPLMSRAREGGKAGSTRVATTVSGYSRNVCENQIGLGCQPRCPERVTRVKSGAMCAARGSEFGA